jgi:hypothetical protein
MIQSTSWTLHEAIRFDRNGITTRDWSGYPILIIPDSNLSFSSYASPTNCFGDGLRWSPAATYAPHHVPKPPIQQSASCGRPRPPRPIRRYFYRFEPGRWSGRANSGKTKRRWTANPLVAYSSMIL